MGLAPDPSGEGGPADPTLRLQEVLTDRIGGTCMNRDDAMAFVESQFTALGLADWTVKAPTPFTPGAPCASLAIDVSGRTVTLVPHRDPSSP